MSPPERDHLVGQNVGGYLVVEPLGEGGMGLVYRARHPLLNRSFAIKVLRPEIATDAVSSSNFVREAQTLSSLKHPSIIDIVGFGLLGDGRHYMVMEFLLGRTLEQELADHGRLDAERALKLSDEILDALSAAHSVEVIHRDMKPSNVFLEKVSGGREVVKLLDFGLAKQQPVALTETEAGVNGTSAIAGTPEYIAPEQAVGRPASTQSDLYSFGVMLFEMLSGSLPFKPDQKLEKGPRVLELMTRHVHQAPPTLQEAAPDVRFPEGLAEIIADLLLKDPAERPSSADTVRKRLARIHRGLQQEVTQHQRNPLLALAGTPEPKRKPRAPWFALAVLLLLLAGAWTWERAPVAVPPLVLLAAPAPVPVVLAAAEPEPLPQELDAEPGPLDDLEGLGSVKPRRLRPPAPPCAPDAEWKKRARADLNEVATRAATSDPEITLWVADREGPLSAAIEGATSEKQCRAVGLQLAQFKQKLKSR